MDKIDWKAKLTSRKFWAAVVSFVSAVLTAANVPANSAAQITAIITAGATVVAYIIGEGLVDAASAGATVNIDNATVSDTPEQDTPAK